jgi:hypothetical protein
VGLVAPDAVGADIQLPVPTGAHLVVTLDTKVRDLIVQLVRMGPGVGIMTETTALLQSRMDVGFRWFVVVAFLTGGCWFGGRHVGVVTLLAIIFFEGGMFMGLIGYLRMTVPALSVRDLF